MKRNNLKWALPLAALCLLTTACSKDNETEPTDGKTRSLTISCGIGETDSKADTRASVMPNNPDESKEKFIWHKGDALRAFLIPEGSVDFDNGATSFSIDENYDNANPSNVASFSSSFPTGSYQMLATYRGSGVTFDKTSNSGELSFRFFTDPQIGKNDTRHLKYNMCMYAIATVTDKNVPSLTFHHLSSLFRFTVTNNNSSACRISSISVKNSSGNRIFGTHYTFKVTNWENGTIDIKNGTAGDMNAASIEQTLQDPADANKGIELSGTGNSFDAYTIIGPNAPLTGETLEFVIKVTDIDGTKERTYTSLALDADKIIEANKGATTWEMGKRYWFNLVLDSELTVSIAGVTPLPGWGTEDGETEI